MKYIAQARSEILHKTVDWITAVTGGAELYEDHSECETVAKNMASHYNTTQYLGATDWVPATRPYVD
jgi:hypothetical protein